MQALLDFFPLFLVLRLHSRSIQNVWENHFKLVTFKLSDGQVKRMLVGYRNQFNPAPWRNLSLMFTDLKPGYSLGNQYLLKEVVGEGGFGQVWIAVANGVVEEPNSPVIAVKVLSTKSEHDRVYRGRNTVHRELEVIRELNKLIEENGGRNPGIVKLLGCTEGLNRVFIHLEFGEMSLSSFMDSNDHYPMPGPHALEISRQLLTAVAFLHRHGITHGDIKPANVLLLSSNYVPGQVDGTQWLKTCRRPKTLPPRQPSSIRVLKDRTVRLIDFGQASHSSERRTGKIGTLVYRPPEMILQSKWTEKIDIWCLGITFLEIWTGQQPFWDVSNDIQHLTRMESVLGNFSPEMLEHCRLHEHFAQNFLPRREADIASGAMPWEKSADHWRNGGSMYKTPQPIGNHFPTIGWMERCARYLVEKMMSYKPEDRGTAEEALATPLFK